MQRKSGILLHPTSLPGRYGIGDLGKEAHRFVDILASGKQGVWQVLPLGPTGYGDSPYQSFSVYAGNPLLVSPELLVERGLLTKGDLARCPKFPADHVDYGPVIEFKRGLLRHAFEAFKHSADTQLQAEYLSFCQRSATWLDTYVRFQTIKESRGGAPWNTWDQGLAAREAGALDAAARELGEEIEAAKFAQFLFFTQWHALKRYANERGVHILGDTPIFVAYDSADVWANRELFQLDDAGVPTVVAGVPPDYFSKTGQLWGNPLYDWNRLRETGYAWWIDRIRASLELFDLLRLDHFRGFAASWEVPAGEPTAINGRWVTVPGREMFSAVRDALGEVPIVAEDLGLITPDVETLRDDFGFPGMRVLQFGFTGGRNSNHLPHTYVSNSVVYTGTHDNDTTVGWFEAAHHGARRKERARCLKYLNTAGEEIHWDFIRAVLASVSDTAIVPLQDLLGCGSAARMNSPGSTDGNWAWRVGASAYSRTTVRRLRELTELYGRWPEPQDTTEDAR